MVTEDAKIHVSVTVRYQFRCLVHETNREHWYDEGSFLAHLTISHQMTMTDALTLIEKKKKEVSQG